MVTYPGGARYHGKPMEKAPMKEPYHFVAKLKETSTESHFWCLSHVLNSSPKGKALTQNSSGMFSFHFT